ncbi:MAG: RNA polymerase sigma factor [Flavobacteriales bacterium]|nr:RNA polymerase sigma factor [Flavobacteriales bacterium]
MTVKEYNQCVDLFADGIYRFILKNIKDSDRAQDIVQDTFEKVWHKITEISFAKAKSYFFSTAYHTMLDIIKKEKRMVNEEFEQLDVRSHETQYSDINEILNRALDTLPEVQKNAILLRDYEGYNYSEIGEILDLNESQVKVYIYRARKHLQQYLVKVDLVI